MSRRRFIAAILSIVVATAAVGARIASADLTTFAAGDLLIMRGGDASYSQATYSLGEVPAYLDEYTPAGVFVGSYPIPTSALTLPGIGTSSHEGRLELSGDGHYVNFAGYHEVIDPNYARSTFGDAGAESGPTTRDPDPEYYQIGQVSGNGVFVHSALNLSVANPQYLRTAYSNDGNEAWVGSKYNGVAGSGSGGGLEYISNFGAGAIGNTVALQGGTDWRDLKVNGSQLFGGTGSSSVGTHGLYAIGSGQPTSGTPNNTRLTGTNDNSGSGFTFATLPGTQPITGVSGSANTVYMVGDPSGNAYIGKLYSAGGTPLSQDNLTFASRQIITTQISGPEAIVARIDPTNSSWVDLFVQNSSGVYLGIDKSGTSNGSFGTLSFTKIISSAADGSTNFYGLSFAPTPLLLKGDMNFDGHVDTKDIAALQLALANTSSYLSTNFGNGAPATHGVTAGNIGSYSDVNGVGNFNNSNLQALLIYLKAGHGSAAAVPEPSGLLMAGLSVVALLRFSSRRRDSGR